MCVIALTVVIITSKNQKIKITFFEISLKNNQAYFLMFRFFSLTKNYSKFLRSSKDVSLKEFSTIIEDTPFSFSVNYQPSIILILLNLKYYKFL